MAKVFRKVKELNGMGGIYGKCDDCTATYKIISHYHWTACRGWLSKAMGFEDEDYDFPKSLEEFGYKFDEDGQLKTTDTNEPFVFRARDNHHFNQKRYEALGEVVTDYIYDLMEKEINLERVYVPIEAEPEDPQSFIFVSKDALTSSKLLVLIHGSGAVRAGQWTRKLIINNNINIGSQLPYIRQGMKEGYGIIVLNTNLNAAGKGGYERLIRGSESPERHGDYVFKKFVMKSEASCIAVVAHSYGGIVTQELVKAFPAFFKDRVFALAFTDSVHSFRRMSYANQGETHQFFKERGCNFAASYAPKNVPQNEGNDECPAVSAGTDKHEWTSHASFDILFDFLSERLNDWVKNKDLENIPVDHEILYKPEVGDEAVRAPTEDGNEVKSSQTGKKDTDSDNIDPATAATHASNDQSKDSTGGTSLKQDVQGEKMQVCQENGAETVDTSNLHLESKNVETKTEKAKEKTESDTKDETKDEKTSEVSSPNLEQTKDKTIEESEKTNQESVVEGEKTKESVVEDEKTKESIVKGAKTKESIVEGEKTKESVVEGQKTKETIVEGDKTKESVVEGEKTKESVVEGEKTKEAVVEGEKTKEAVVEGDKTKESVVEGEKTKESVVEGEKTKEAVVEGEKTKEAVVEGDKTKESVVEGEKTKEAVVEGDKTKESVVEGDKTKESVLEGEKTKEAVVEGDKTKESVLEGEKTKEAVVEGEKTKESVLEGEKTKASVVEGEKTNESIIEGDKTKESVVEGDKTKESIVEGEKTKESEENAEKKQLDVEKTKVGDDPKSSLEIQSTHTADGASKKDEL